MCVADGGLRDRFSHLFLYSSDLTLSILWQLVHQPVRPTQQPSPMAMLQTWELVPPPLHSVWQIDSPWPIQVAHRHQPYVASTLANTVSGYFLACEWNWLFKICLTIVFQCMSMHRVNAMSCHSSWLLTICPQTLEWHRWLLGLLT